MQKSSDSPYGMVSQVLFAYFEMLYPKGSIKGLKKMYAQILYSSIFRYSVVSPIFNKRAASDLNNQSGAGYSVPTQNERAYAYQHFTLGLLEAKNCIGWHWFKYQDDDGTDNSSKPANKGLYDNSYQLFPYLSFFARELNFNAYDLIQYFDKQVFVSI